MENTETNSLLIIEDHKIVSLGLKTLAERTKHFASIDCAYTASQALELTVDHNKLADPYSIFLVDVELPDMSGLDLVKSLKAMSPDSAIIFHTIHDELWNLRQMINSGANAIVMKTDDLAELKIAFQRVLDGDNYFSDHFREACEEMANYQTLSEREIEILKLISEGISSKDIAKRIFRTQDTVEFHRKNIMRKLGATNMAQLVKEGIAKGYIN